MKYIACLLLFTLVHAKSIIKTDLMIIEKEMTAWTQIRDTNLTKQKYDYSCGAASLSTILTYYYNIDKSEKDILDFILQDKGIDLGKKEEIEINDDLKNKARTSFLDLAKYAELNGLKSLGLALDMESLGKLKVPAILYVKARNNDHFSVYRGMDNNYVYLSDPSFGNIKISKAKFKEMFYRRDDRAYPGKLLAFLPNSEDIKANQEFMSILHNARFIEEVSCGAI